MSIHPKRFIRLLLWNSALRQLDRENTLPVTNIPALLGDAIVPSDRIGWLWQAADC
jgi:hypothetical protein